MVTERAYYRLIRKNILKPLQATIAERMRGATDAQDMYSRAIHAIKQEAGRSHSGRVTPPTFEEIQQAVTKSGFSRIGLRAHKGILAAGDDVPDSYVWIDDECTDERLEGACAIDLRADEWGEITEEDYIKALKEIEAYDGQLIVIGTNSPDTYEGNDVGEIVMPDAVVISTVDDIKDPESPIAPGDKVGSYGQAEAEAFVMQTAKKHKQEFTKAMRKAFEIDVNPMMPDGVVDPFIEQATRDNIGLIESIPEELVKDLQKQFPAFVQEHGLDQQKFMQLLTERFGVADRRAKLITRDQNNKLIGALNQSRNKQLGIERYIWRTADDSAVRDRHAQLDKTEQRWDKPPVINDKGEVGHPGKDIQCRCIAISIIE